LLVANNFQGRQFHMDFEIDRAPVSFSFTLSGRMRCTIKHGWRSKTVAERSPGDAVLAYLPQTSGTVEIFTGGHAGGVSLHFSLPAFNGLFPSLPQPLEHLAAGTGGPWKCGPVYHQSRFGAETLHVLQHLIFCVRRDSPKHFLCLKIQTSTYRKLRYLWVTTAKPISPPPFAGATVIPPRPSGGNAIPAGSNSLSRLAGCV